MTTTDSSLAASGETAQPTNFYEEIGLDRNETTAIIRDKLHDLRLGWSAKAARAGSLGDKARHQLLLIARAADVFASDDAREQYDLGLIRRSAAAPTEEAKVDWLARAWGYYFVRDDGAAAVAARKARERDPNDAMVYVVSAWIKVWQDEFKQAKQDADEAFVLDELGEDTADVHHVRGVVFLLLDDYDKALQSFDRALPRASEGERPEILWRKALAYECKKDGRSMLDCCLEALSSGVDITDMLAGNITATTNRAIERVCHQDNDPSGSAQGYRNMRSRIQSATMPAATRTAVLAFIDGAIALKDLESRSVSLSQVADVSGGQPDFPLVPIGVAVLFLFIGFAWPFAFLVALGLGGWATVQLNARSEWTKGRAAYVAAQSELARVTSSIASSRKKLIPMLEPPAVGRR